MNRIAWTSQCPTDPTALGALVSIHTDSDGEAELIFDRGTLRLCPRDANAKHVGQLLHYATDDDEDAGCE
jgi:hypothetical protein